MYTLFVWTVEIRFVHRQLLHSSISLGTGSGNHNVLQYIVGFPFLPPMLPVFRQNILFLHCPLANDRRTNTSLYFLNVECCLPINGKISAR